MNHKIPYKKDDVLIWKNGPPVQLLEDPQPWDSYYLVAQAYNSVRGLTESVYFRIDDGGRGWSWADDFERWVREVRKDGTGSALQ